MDEKLLMKLMGEAQEEAKRRKREHEKRIYTFKAEYGLLGFSSDQKTIKLDDEILISTKPKHYLKEFYARANNRYLTKKNQEEYTYLLTYSYQGKLDRSYRHQEAENVYERLSFLFRLFKSGNIEFDQYQMWFIPHKGTEFVKIGFYIMNHDGLLRENEFHLERSEVLHFRKLWKALKALDFNSKRALYITLKRFNQSFYKKDWEDQIIDLMIAYEALFLDDRNELSYRLALRVSQYVDCDLSSEMLFRFIKKSYDLRRKIVHGHEVKGKDLRVEGLDFTHTELLITLRKILRIGLKKYIHGPTFKSNTEFIESLDMQLIKR